MRRMRSPGCCARAASGHAAAAPPMSLTNARRLTAEQRERDGDVERLGGLEVQEQLNFRGLLYRQLARLFAFKNTGGVNAGETVSVAKTGSIARQAAGCDKLAIFVDRRHSVAEGQSGELFAPSSQKRIGVDNEPARSQFDNVCENAIEVTFGASI